MLVREISVVSPPDSGKPGFVFIPAFRWIADVQLHGLGDVETLALVRDIALDLAPPECWARRSD